MGRQFSLKNLFSDENLAAAWPFYLILYLVLIGIYVAILVSDSMMRDVGRAGVFTVLMLVHAILYGLNLRWALRGPDALGWQWQVSYCLMQGGLLFGISVLTAFQGFLVGLYISLTGETVGVLWPHWRRIVPAVFFYLALLAINAIVVWGWETLVSFLPMIGAVLAFVFIYVVLYIRQVDARERAQGLLGELEIAHHQLQEYARQVEELAVVRERERMARELHDTLAQGLAGLILQLEAVDSHMESDNLGRAQEVVQQAMQRARTTLQEARRAIQALRPAALEQGNLIEALSREIEQCSATSGLRTTFEVESGPLDVSEEEAWDILRILQESLTNVARHAQASHVLVRLGQSDRGIRLLVQDDGVGFDPIEVLDLAGRLGLAGMRERAQRLGGELRVNSAPGRGTQIVLEMGGYLGS